MSMMRSSRVEERFCSYYELWIKQLEGHLQQLVLGHQPDYESIVATLKAHHKDFYTAKWAAAHEDVLAFFSPQYYLSPLETAFLWVTGWKPSTAFRLVDSLRSTRAPLTSLAQLTEGQARSICELRASIKSEMEKVERELERRQVALGDWKMVELARLASRVRKEEEDESTHEGEEVKVLLQGLEKVMKMGDYVRLKTLKGILNVLSPRQGVDFLAVFAMLQIQIRKLGKERAATNSSSITLFNFQV